MAVALLLAAGLGERLGLKRPKALAELAGRPLWHWSADVLLAVEEIERIVVATPPGLQDTVRASVAALGSAGAPAAPTTARALAGRAPADLIVVGGGAVRSQSVQLALDAAGEIDDDGLVLVHDAARPLLTAEIVRATLAAAAREGVDAAIAASPVTDTIKQAGEDGRVLRTLDRSALWSVQTPQVFRRVALERALAVSEDLLAQATDDAWLVERTGGNVQIVEAPRENLKVTTPLDLKLVELLLSGREAPSSTPAGAGTEDGGERGERSPA